MDELTALDVIARLGLALAFGAVVGWEREQRTRPAGLRTHMLVALGSSAFAVVAVAMTQQYAGSEAPSLNIDPTRIIEGVVGGVGFLGAGAIIHHQQRVKGMTTAAGIWVVAAVGVAAGTGYYMIAGLCVGFALVTLVCVRWAEAKADGSDKAPRDDGLE